MEDLTVAKKRVLYIDCLKGFAILLVVIGHVFDGYLRASLFIDHSSFMSSGYNLIYAFHMALFFMISGFVFCKAYIKNGMAKLSLNKQILNIICIYLVFSILFGLFKCAMGSFTNTNVSLLDILLIWMKPIYPYWYLYVLLFYYLIFRLKVVYQVKTFSILAPLFLVSVASNFVPHNISYLFEIKHFLYYCFFFGLGVMISSHEKWYTTKEVLFAVPAFMISIILMLVIRVGYTYEDFLDGKIIGTANLNTIVAYGLCLMLLFLFRLICSDEKYLHVKFLSFLGQYSLEIYVIHCIFTAGNRVVLSKFGINIFYLNIILNVVISITAPIVFSLLCKKIGIHKYIFRPAYVIVEKRTNRMKGES
ncbi:MAG: acyltransferase [Ruminococcus sp.]|nr:acyltransferase [Ruminococcus sp.]